MAVYLTKSMLTRLNKMRYTSSSPAEVKDSNAGDQWQRLMEGPSLLSKEMICRVCARSGCTPLTEKINEFDITTAIRSVTSVTIDINDSLPKYICTDCLEMLKIALNFKLNCETSDKKFRKLINPIDDLNYNSYPSFKHDFHSILHNIKLKRMKIEEEIERRRQKKERIMLKKLPKVKQFKCSPCELVFPNKEKLIAHRRERQCRRPVQKQSTSHKCNTCGKEFPIVARLKNHMLVHTNTFNFFCDLCPYKCKYKYYLVMHMRTHTGEKPYKCSQCNATFVNPSNLNKHKLTHQEKQFKCLLCEKAFRTNKLLREHHEAKHMNIKHTCHFCGRDFCYKPELALKKDEVKLYEAQQGIGYF
ncbi:hypothetical protein O3G_MSEX014905 [Manduca sexta]|uniref:Uncharacterized protein n=1 Tax=Manduca sexta TaxID=7130 RepID=A0A922D153_MANSE|nr:hypothetical protein O3G_MSEX014905 [Manduca sexta]